MLGTFRNKKNWNNRFRKNLYRTWMLIITPFILKRQKLRKITSDICNSKENSNKNAENKDKYDLNSKKLKGWRT